MGATSNSLLRPTPEAPLLTVLAQATATLLSLLSNRSALLGVTCNGLLLPFAAPLCRVPGRLRWRYSALLPCLVDVEKLGGEEGELWFLGLVGQSTLYLQFLRCLASRDKSGVARLCSVIVAMSSHLESRRPGSGRVGRSLYCSRVYHTINCTLSYYLLTIWKHWTLSLQEIKFCLLLYEFELYKADDTRITIYRSDVVFAS
jgi:hypothetical protein